MKKIVHINSVNFGSTGKIMLQIHDVCKERNYSSYVSYPKSRDNLNKKCDDAIIIGNRYLRNLHIWLAKFTGFNGYFSCVSTLLFLKKIKKISPDIIHLHNLHNCYINLPLLFKYVKKKNVAVVWTLHDCWAFTGQCPHFTLAKCDKWKTGCHDCQSYREYPESYVDRTKVMWKLKKKWFTGVKDITIVTPSQWLADLVKESFLKECTVKVINNGIDLSIFQPTESDFRKKYGIPQNKKILLGVAFGWGIRKGLDVFIELANRLDNNEYQIVLVGTDDGVDQQIPKNIISIHRTQNQTELAEIYTAADLFVNPTREDTYPTVNMESIACGTPVLTFRTGGSPECIDEFSGSVVECDDIDSLLCEIKRICEQIPYSREFCVDRAKAFDMNERFNEYIALYEALIC
ncbi:MAG: glycosyltransferase [Ruminococcaceae bacterium]|nr:glycosyltransferase [Oscillospiraceae bacterium]